MREIQEDPDRLRHPVILAHALFGFDQVSVLGKPMVHYFAGMPAWLRATGNVVHVSRVAPMGPIAQTTAMSAVTTSISPPTARMWSLSPRAMPWWAGGVALVTGATGAALLWTGLVGNKPDWIDGQ